MSLPTEPNARSTEPRIRCEICGAPGRPWHQVREHRLLRCDDCHHGWLESAPDEEWLARLYDEAYFKEGGDGYPDYLAAETAIRRTARGHLDVLERVLPSRGRLLDLGCAAGFLLDEARQRGWETVGVELSGEMSRYARETLGLSVHRSTCCQRIEGEPAADAITMVQVLEHVPHPVRCCLESVAAQLRPGGVFLVETWDCDSRTARIAGRHWQQLSPPSVQHWFSERSLRRTLERAGLAVLSVDRPGKVVDIDRVLSLVESKYAPRAASLARRVARRLGVQDRSIPYPLDDLLRVVARRA